MATEDFIYLTYAEAVVAHIELMHLCGETRYGVFDRSLVESALARPRQAATYSNADIYAQAATLLFGFVKNHPWVGGNKRTATVLVDLFLNKNGFEIIASQEDLVELVLEIEEDRWQALEIDQWLRVHVQAVKVTPAAS